LAADVRLVQGDLFQNLLGESFDLIVSNPPYVGLHEALPAEVREFEPSEALYSGHTGLEIYERLSQTAADYLRDGGRMMMEVGYRQATEVALIFESAGWTVVETVKDLSGIDRVVIVEPVFACAT
jgi:release factor glutamine methyltransferase